MLIHWIITILFEIRPPFTRYEVCSVITRCLIMHSDVCSTVDEVVKEFTSPKTEIDVINLVSFGTKLELVKV